MRLSFDVLVRLKTGDTSPLSSMSSRMLGSFSSVLNKEALFFETASLSYRQSASEILSLSPTSFNRTSCSEHQPHITKCLRDIRKWKYAGVLISLSSAPQLQIQTCQIWRHQDSQPGLTRALVSVLLPSPREKISDCRHHSIPIRFVFPTKVKRSTYLLYQKPRGVDIDLQNSPPKKTSKKLEETYMCPFPNYLSQFPNFI